MIYYNLQSEYPGDVTKHCGLTIDEVDGNFYELERMCMETLAEVNSIRDEIREIKDEIEEIKNKPEPLSWTTHDTVLCPPGTSNDATYEHIDGNRYEMFISGTVSYYTDSLPDGSVKGNRLGIAIAPLYRDQKTMFPDATFSIDGVECGKLWDEIESNPEGWPEALYIYPKVERIGGEIKVSLAGQTYGNNELTVTIDWDADHSEAYKYVVDEDIELETILSRTVHDGEICPPGTSDEGTYTISPEDVHTMVIGGSLDVDAESGKHVFGVAVEPTNGVNAETYPYAQWFVSDGESFYPMGNFWDSVSEGDGGCASALYLKPDVERTGSGNVIVSLDGHTLCNNMIIVKVDWNSDLSEQYVYIVDRNITLKTGNE